MPRVRPFRRNLAGPRGLRACHLDLRSDLSFQPLAPCQATAAEGSQRVSSAHRRRRPTTRAKRPLLALHRPVLCDRRQRPATPCLSPADPNRGLFRLPRAAHCRLLWGFSPACPARGWCRFPIAVAPQEEPGDPPDFHKAAAFAPRPWPRALPPPRSGAAGPTQSNATCYLVGGPCQAAAAISTAWKSARTPQWEALCPVSWKRAAASQR